MYFRAIMKSCVHDADLLSKRAYYYSYNERALCCDIRVHVYPATVLHGAYITQPLVSGGAKGTKNQLKLINDQSE